MPGYENLLAPEPEEKEAGEPTKVAYRVTFEGEPVAEVHFPREPEHYRRVLRVGKPTSEIAPTIACSYLICLTVFRQCQYFGSGEECQCCDINRNYNQQREAGQPYTNLKSVEALSIIDSTDTLKKAYTLTGGSVTTTLRGKSEADSYVENATAIEKHFRGRWLGKAVVQALPCEELLKFRDVGIRIYYPNYEVWGRGCFRRSVRASNSTLNGRPGLGEFLMYATSSEPRVSSRPLLPASKYRSHTGFKRSMKRSACLARGWSLSCPR